ncbi:MAG: sigma-70 family RNA polymerase sigma factor [Phycisphaera sp.]|nr:sigma-70 family RNA polymerase sigma factor [Phycisphaera sp.]
MDSQAFRDMALAEIEAVHRMAYHLSRNPDTAADLVQETYLKALAGEATFELREKGIRPWLFKILHNLYFTHLSKNRRAPVAVEDSEMEAAASQTDEEPPAWDLASLDWEQVDDRLKHAIADLQPDFREVLLLWAVEGLKYREIADVVGVPLGTVMSRLHRARALLSNQLTDLAKEHGIAVVNA